MDTTDVKMILDSIKDLKKDFDEKFRNISAMLNKNMDATNNQAIKNERHAAKIETIEKNVTELWERIHKHEDHISGIDKKIETHLSSENTEEKGKMKNFNWINLITPLILTAGLFIIGIMISNNKP